jgi:hypothetical protein
MSKYVSVLEEPVYGSNAWKRKKEKEQALETDTTLESALISPVKAGAAAVKNLIKGGENMVLAAKPPVTPRIGSNLPKIDPSKATKESIEALRNREKRAALNAIDRVGNNATKEAIKRAFLLEVPLDIKNTYERYNDRSEANEASKLIKDQSEKRRQIEKQLFDGYKKGGKVSKSSKVFVSATASHRGDGIAQKGKTKGRIL